MHELLQEKCKLEKRHVTEIEQLSGINSAYEEQLNQKLLREKMELQEHFLSEKLALKKVIGDLYVALNEEENGVKEKLQDDFCCHTEYCQTFMDENELNDDKMKTSNKDDPQQIFNLQSEIIKIRTLHEFAASKLLKTYVLSWAVLLSFKNAIF